MVSNSTDSSMDYLAKEARSSMLPYTQRKLPTVVTYQLPVPCGDCSVHLLLDVKGNTYSAFIMDGGRDVQGLKSCQVILYGLHLIAKIHLLVGPFLRAWVVTHWDKDHYKGVLDLINTEKLKTFVHADDFYLYCVTGANTTRASGALRAQGIQTKSIIGTDAIGCNFFGEKFNEFGIGFWCIGGDGYSFKKGGFKFPPTPQTPGDKTNLELVCKGNAPTQNEKSLMAAVMWTKVGKGEPRFSYFCAGDGNVPLEKSNICPEVLQGRPVKAFKLDHHGSSGEFSQGEILRLLDLPQRLIVTPGHQYGHPCWDVLFLISSMYKQHKPGHGGKLLYTTRLPYWVDANKFEKWYSTDINISSTGRLNELFRNGGPLSPKTKFLSGDESKQALVRVLEDDQMSKRTNWSEFLNTPMLEKDDEDEKDDPTYTYEDALEEFLMNKLSNEKADPYESIQARVVKELEEAAKKGTDAKYKMKDDEKMVIEAPSKDGNSITEEQQAVVQACVGMWNTISEQRINENEEQTKYYLLQLISANHDELDGGAKAFEWPALGDWSPKAKI